MTTLKGVRSAAAIRQARYRRHHKNDHSMCLPDRCDVLRPAENPNEVPSEQPAERPSAADTFGPSGKALWDGTLKFGQLTAAQRVLLREVCRMADRVDELHADIEAYRGDLGTVKWLLREARQQAIAMKGLVAELRQSGVAGGGAQNDPADDEGRGVGGPAALGGGGGPGIADITARIAAKYAQAQG